MIKYPRVAALGMTLFCTVLGASCSSSHNSSDTGASGGSHSGTVNMFCFTSPDTRKVVVSSVFAVRPYPPERMIEEPWAVDFRRYIGQSGNEGGINVTCSQVDSTDASKIKADELRKQGHEVVETKWSYAGG
jgi:hypothetical protein